MPVSVGFMKKLDKVSPDMREILIGLLEEIEKQREESVGRKDFLRFAQRTEENFQQTWKVIRELADAQRRTEERVSKLEEAIERLAEAQRKTEERVSKLEETVERLAEAQKKTEERVSKLEEAIERLAEAQRKTEERVSRLEETVERLAEAQKRTEERLNELSEAQRKTEEELRKLIGEHRKTREELGGLSHAVGYILEDRAYASLPELLKKDLSVDVEVLKRDFVELGPGRYEEVNILGKGQKNGEMVWIIGECKTQLKKRDVDTFLRKMSRIEHLFPGDKVYVAVTYQTSPQVREYLKKKGLKLYFSYQFRI